MSLLRLLTAGKSLVGLKKSDNRYHVTRQRLLPEFGAKKNPFRTMAESGCDQSALVTSPTVPETANSVRLGSNGTAAATHLAAAPEFRVTAGDATSCISAKSGGSGASDGCRNAAQEETAAAHRGLGNWVSTYARKMTSLGSQVGSKPLKAVVPKFEKPMIQAELSLERVTVVRNDLSDSDLEIVRMMPQRSVPKQEIATDTEGKAAPIETSWSQMAGRLFGAGKT